MYIAVSIEISSAANIVIYMLCVKRYRRKLRSMCRAKIQPTDELFLTTDNVRQSTK